MSKYVALLRGINVGGKNIIKMADLKNLFEENGFLNVATYINSGNVISESAEKNARTLTTRLERTLSERFSYKARVILRTQHQMKKMVEDAPANWETGKDLRCYVGFLSDAITAQDAANFIKIKEGVDELTIGDGVLYMTTLMDGVSRSAFDKLPSLKIYQEMTIRNYNTAQRIVELMKANTKSSK